ncbi:MAG: tetratricopeptide repeat protein [Defluviitaleaceae bacterium]|nr:tetratricopeptide repeat protein [Defluviitaleaceae bacterium]
MDGYLQRLARGISNRQYNAGLALAQAGDLSGAVKTLNVSLQTNKKNTYARNLLGLCYYACGKLGNALEQWALSCHYQPEANLAKRYLEEMGKDLTALESQNEALKGYNEALGFFRDDNDDLAVIRLKRAVELLPRFVDAMNLLAAYYLKVQDKTRAAAMAERVLAIDKGNENAKGYYFAIFQKHYGEKTARPQRAETKKPEKAEPAAQKQANNKGNPLAVRNQKAFTKASPVSGIVSAVFGMGAMFLFMQLLILPGNLAERDEEIAATHAQIAALGQEHEEAVTVLNEYIAVLQGQVSDLEGQNAANMAHLADTANEMMVRDAQQLLNDGFASAALAMLDNVDLARLNDDGLAIYDNIQVVATPLAEQAYHAQATALFNAGNHADARLAWESAAQHSSEGSAIGGDVLYWLGRIAEIDGDPARALLYYETALENFPNFTRRWQATSRRNVLS